LIFNTAHHVPANRGELRLVMGPRPLLPLSLGAMSSTSADYLVEVTRPGVVQVRVEADGIDPDGNEVSDKGVVEVIATDRDLSAEQRQAVFAGGFVDYTSRVQEIADKELKQFLEQLRKALPRELKSEGNKTSDQEDLLAEALGLPPGALSFLPPQVRNYLLFCEARGQGEWSAWERRIGSTAEKSVKLPLQFWDNQWTGSDPATKFKVGQELYAIASEKSSGLASATGTFARDSFSLIDTKAPARSRRGFRFSSVRQLRRRRPRRRGRSTSARASSGSWARRLSRTIRRGSRRRRSCCPRTRSPSMPRSPRPPSVS